MVKDHSGSEGRKYLMTHSTHFIYGYMASDMVKNHSGSEGKEGIVLFNNALNTFYLGIWLQTYGKGPLR